MSDVQVFVGVFNIQMRIGLLLQGIKVLLSAGLFVFLGNGDVQWCFSQVKGTLDDDVTEADIISCVEFNHDGELLATGDKVSVRLGQRNVFSFSYKRELSISCLF